MNKKQKEKCQDYDYSLVESARLALKKPNKFICACIHCRQQAITEESINHTKECCFNPPGAAHDHEYA